VATNTGIMATQVYTIGIVPTRPGTMTLPAIRMPWWNTETNKLEMAEIAATTITVAPNAAATVASPGFAPTRQPPVATSLNTPLPPTPSPWTNIATALAALFALLWLITLALWWRDSRRLQGRAIAPNNDSTIPMAQDTNALFQRLTQACQSNDALAARHALFLWGKKQHPQINSNHELALALNHAALTQEIALLERTIYAADSQQSWQGAALLAALKERMAQKQNTGRETMLLSEMNPH
jgi:hypothetical protein